jgi:hypothetical protein
VVGTYNYHIALKGIEMLLYVDCKQVESNWARCKTAGRNAYVCMYVCKYVCVYVRCCTSVLLNSTAGKWI